MGGGLCSEFGVQSSENPKVKSKKMGNGRKEGGKVRSLEDEKP
jgi:hypothetical protein